MEEVVGSTPISSTIFYRASVGGDVNRASVARRILVSISGVIRGLASGTGRDYRVMKVFRLAYTHLSASILMAALLLAAVPAGAQQTSVSTHNQMPDILVWIDARTPGMHWVSLTYPKTVPRSQAQEHLDRLLQETGWSVTNVNISDDSVMASGENPMTSVEFATPAAIQPGSGVLDIEPIVKALRDLQNIQVQYLVSPSFKLRGPGDYENKYVKIALIPGSNAYRYTVQVKDAGFSTLDIPMLPDQNHPPAVSGRPWPTIRILLVLLALATGLLVYFTTTNFANKGRQRPGRRS